MTRNQWELIARALRDARKEIEDSWPPRHGYMSNAPDTHDRKLIRGAKLSAVDEAARAVCGALRTQSSRFSGERFLRIVGVKPG